MAQHMFDVYSKSLTPREPNLELLDASCERNIIVCLCNGSGKTFIANKLNEHIRHRAISKEGTITLYVADSSSVISRQASCFRRLTDITVVEYDGDDLSDVKNKFKKSGKDKIFLMETRLAVFLFENDCLDMSEINLLILYGCQCVLENGSVPLKELMQFYFKSLNKPHLLGLASSIFSSNLDLSRIESSLRKMEDLLDCKAETASNVVSILRYATSPKEIVLEYGPHTPTPIDKVIEDELLNALNFLKDHCYSPEDIYEEFSDELQRVPDPKAEPEKVFLELLSVLHTMGPWSADRAALVLLVRTEKLKVTTPYERHFLLLCMTSTVLIKIRAILDDFFKNVNEKDRIYKYCSPKVLRLVEVLRKFKPAKSILDKDLEEDEGLELDDDDDDEDDADDDGGDAGGGGGGGDELDNVDKSQEHEFMSRCRELLKKKESDCECELMTEYLLNRLQYQSIENLSYDGFVEMLKNYKEGEGEEETKSVPLRRKKSSTNQTDKVTKLKGTRGDINQIDKKESTINERFKSRNRSRSHKYNQSMLTAGRDDANSLSNVIKKKNGYVKVSDSQIINLSSSGGEQKINEVKTLENYIQCHEYLLLPKFRVDRQTRYDRCTTHQKGFSHEEAILRQMRYAAESELCGLIFVENKFLAKVLFHLLTDLKQADEDFSFINVQFTIGKVVDDSLDPKGAEAEFRKQELVLKRFRMKICNLLIGTSFLEEGIDLPKCNLVVRFDIPKDYRSYINTKERARGQDPWYCLLVDSSLRGDFLETLARYHEVEGMLLKKCGNLEPPEEEETEADQYSKLIQPFCPLLEQNAPHIDLNSAITLVNRYCAKLPSDTFTRLTPKWSLKTVNASGENMFVCSIKLPINSPLKQVIEGCPMPTRVLARRFAAFQCCQALHALGELDDNLQPISKEVFWMREEEQLTPINDDWEDKIPKNNTEPRPGSTKRRQYYYKKIADSLTDCLPIAGKPAYLYNIIMELTCPLPEEQNTRGRKIHPPEESTLGFGIMTRKSIPRIGAFPIFTRSGEVQVKLQLAQSTVELTESQIEKIIAFIQYTFTSVLRLQKYLMMFDPKASENSYFIVPTRKGPEPHMVQVDWDFLDLIYRKKDHVRTFLTEEQRKGFVFDPKKFEDAVVSPWYRNQDQPHYLYVAEICKDLTPRSSFPGTEYTTFEEYYLKKYNIQIQNRDQALLDVDHTSARLNFLTPRYVNRKGVALPTTSEEKKRAKRENLKQKQILIPELCDIHPFPATLWRKAVCLPCILHRINALLLADQMRRLVAKEIGVGKLDLDGDFNWKPLDFGWSLADVLKQTKTSKDEEDEDERENENTTGNESKAKETTEKKIENETNEVNEKENDVGGGLGGGKDGCWIEIGTWSNEMAKNPPKIVKPVGSNGNKLDEDEDDDEDLKQHLNSLPGNITMIDKASLSGTDGWDSKMAVNLGSSMSFQPSRKWFGNEKSDELLSDYSSDSSYSADYLDEVSSTDTDSECGGIKIQFTDENVAEAVENQIVACHLKDLNEVEEDEPWCSEETEEYIECVNEFKNNLDRRKDEIIKSDKYFREEAEFDIVRTSRSTKDTGQVGWTASSQSAESFGNADNVFPRLVEEIPEDVKGLPYTNLILKSLEDEEKKMIEFGKKLSQVDEERRISVNEKHETLDTEDICKDFSFDEQPTLEGHPGPSPSLILQALTMSNANDGINLERLETIGDSFLKYAITTYLYCVYDRVHEGKLSHLRSKQVSNFHLYRLGRRKILGESMIATKFEPHDNWLPPCYYVPIELERALIEAGLPASHWNRADLPSLKNLSREEICKLVREKVEKLDSENSNNPNLQLELPSFIPYNLMTQHSIPDKSIADCVEALIGAYLVACGPRGALLFMSWLGIKVLPKEEKFFKSENDENIRKGVGCSPPVKVVTEEGEVWKQEYFGELEPPNEIVFRHIEDPESELKQLLRGFDAFEESLHYRFKNRSYLLQALTHASYTPNRLTDCYQRLEFLGDAILDYIITRHLYEDSRHHSPGALTDLRSALVNNTIFASLAVRHNFHKFFRHLCPGLNDVIDRFVRFQEEHGHSITQECYLKEEYECEEAEDVEVPKALGDIFESIAGAIFIDSGMSLDAVWRVYYRIMKNEIELFSANVPKSPIRELFELEPETAQFGKPEKLADGRRVRVTVEVFGKGVFNGIGRNHRIAKCTAAKCALKKLKKNSMVERKK